MSVIIIPIGIIGALFTTILIFRKQQRQANLMHEYEKNKIQYDEFKSLPFDVKEVEISYDKENNFIIGLTPTYIVEAVGNFTIKSKAKHENGDFNIDFTFTSNDQYKYLISVNTAHANGNNFLHFLAHLFEIEINPRKEIVKETILKSEGYVFTKDSFFEKRTYTCSIIIPDIIPLDFPKLNIELDLNQEKIYLK